MKRAYRQNLILVLIIGLLVHFVAHTVVTYGLNVGDGGVTASIRAWKEILILLAGASFLLSAKKLFQSFRKQKLLLRFAIAVVIVSIVFALLSLVVHQQEIFTFVMSYKYLLFAFLVFIIIAWWTSLFAPKDGEKISKKTYRIVRILLILSLIRRLSLLIYPERLTRLGYDLHIDNITRTASTAPQWVYKTNMRTGYIRNQGIFSGPWSRGFYLILFWPRFVAMTRKYLRGWQKWFWYILFAANIFVTFSRAAQGIRILQTAVLILLFVKWPWKKYLSYIFFWGLFAGIAGIIIVLSTNLRHLVLRYTSDSGHIVFLKQGLEMVVEKPSIWYGAWSAWPASYHVEDQKYFNPENQYLQVMIEYWVRAFILRLALFLTFPFLLRRKKREYIRFVSRGGIALAGLVLHSFSDTMAMYSFMIVAGLGYGSQKNKVKGIKGE